MVIKYEYRCSNCNRLLANGAIKDGTVEIKCQKCGTVNTLSENEVGRDKAKKRIKADS